MPYWSDIPRHRRVAEGSIRLGILKDLGDALEALAENGCRGLDPIGDTESAAD